MHEYPLTLEIIGAAERHAGEGKRVAAINLVVGDYSGVVADCVALYFDLIAENTRCEGAVLNVERVAPMLRCKACGGLFERRPFEFRCPDDRCSGEGEPTEIGREFYIRSIEVSDQHSPPLFAHPPPKAGDAPQYPPSTTGDVEERAYE